MNTKEDAVTPQEPQTEAGRRHGLLARALEETWPRPNMWLYFEDKASAMEQTDAFRELVALIENEARGLPAAPAVPGIEGLRAASEAATPGPWVDQSPTDGEGPNPEWWIDTHAYSDGPQPVVARTYPLGGADARFIVTAVNYVRLALLDATDRDPRPLDHSCANHDESLDDAYRKGYEAGAATRAAAGVVALPEVDDDNRCTACREVVSETGDCRCSGSCARCGAPEAIHPLRNVCARFVAQATRAAAGDHRATDIEVDPDCAETKAAAADHHERWTTFGHVCAGIHDPSDPGRHECACGATWVRAAATPEGGPE